MAVKVFCDSCGEETRPKGEACDTVIDVNGVKDAVRLVSGAGMSICMKCFVTEIKKLHPDAPA